MCVKCGPTVACAVRTGNVVPDLPVLTHSLSQDFPERGSIQITALVFNVRLNIYCCSLYWHLGTATRLFYSISPFLLVI